MVHGKNLHPNVCNTHAANITSTVEFRECAALFIFVPIGLLFVGTLFGVLDYPLVFWRQKK
jgi:hypothetical protein